MLQAVGAAKFLSEKKTSALSYKIAELLGASQAEDMIGTVTESDTKSGNEHVYYNIDAVTSALLEKKKLSFRRVPERHSECKCHIIGYEAAKQVS